MRLVFCEAKRDRPIWPHINYDFEERRVQLYDLLKKKCPGLKFELDFVTDSPVEARAVMKHDNEVDGYIVFVQGLGWRNHLSKLCSSGKPTLLVDHLFGGSGLFLTNLGSILSSGHPVEWVASSNDSDLVASADHFGLLKEGRSAQEVIAACRATRRRRIGQASPGAFAEDALSPRGIGEVTRELADTRILLIGNGMYGVDFHRSAKQVFGVEFAPASFEDLDAFYARVNAGECSELARGWIDAAEEVVEPARQDIEASARMYLAMKKLMGERQAQGISINCIGGFTAGALRAYPCLGFSQLNDDGHIGGCEADEGAALSLVVGSALVGRPGYISDPVIDTSRGSITYAHCVSTTRPFGPRGARSPFRLRSHAEDRKGASMQALLPSGYLTTTVQINPTSRQILWHQARTVGNHGSELACRTKLEAALLGDIEKLAENWKQGWHRVTFYGDLKGPLAELCNRLKIDLVQEA